MTKYAIDVLKNDKWETFALVCSDAPMMLRLSNLEQAKSCGIVVPLMTNLMTGTRKWASILTRVAMTTIVKRG